MRAFAAVISAAALAAVTFPALATTLHVCPDGSGDYVTIQPAVDAASSGDTIELCAGTFEGPGNFDLDFGSKSLTLMSPHGYEATVIDAFYWPDGAEEFEPHFGILLGAGTTTRIEGITIKNAHHRNRLTWEYLDGAAVICPSGTVVLDGVRIAGWLPSGAQRGAGVFIPSGQLTARDCLFQRNKARGEGGAIYSENAWIELNRCTFAGNSACAAGVVVLGDGQIADCVFEENRGGSCDYNPGGSVIRATGTVTIQRSRFTDNIDVYGGCARVVAGSDLLFEDCVIEGGLGESGGVIAISGGRATFRETTFRNNFAAWTGGAISGFGSVALEYCLFENNSNYSPASRGGAGAITMTAPSTLEIRHTTFVRNALHGGATIVMGGGGNLALEGVIIALGGKTGSTFPAVHCSGPIGSLSVHCTDVFGNGGGDWTGCIAGMEVTNGNFSADPLFCDAAAGNFALHSASPCAAAHSGTCGLIGALGVACGPTAVQSSTWGSIKALYR